jgi:hypothetical protein
MFHLVGSMQAQCLLRENFHRFCPQWLSFYFHPSADLYCVSSERTITNFALIGFTFSSFSRFIPCLLRENYHGFCPQWLYIFIPQRIYTMSPQRELSQIFPSVALHFHPSANLYRFSSERNYHRFCP